MTQKFESTLPRRPVLRKFLQGLVAVLSVTALHAAQAQAWPSKPIRLIVPAAPGGSADPLARLVADELGRVLQQPLVVENRPGANGNLGAVMAVKSPADGY